MSPEVAVGLFSQALWLTSVVVAIVVLPSLVIGLIVAMFQAATQINEQTLTFVPKIVAVLGIFAGLFPWMMQLMMEFSVRVMQIVASQGGL